MNACIRYSIALGTLIAAPLPAAEEKPPPKEERRPLRVISTPERPLRGLLREGERREKIEKEEVAFLGVETASVSPTTASQLGLPRGTGLVVNHVVPESPAAGVLQQHDILLRLDDQILIETRQLSVLIRNHQEGDEVALTYMRGGQKSTARVKLGKIEVPKTAMHFSPGLPFMSSPLRAPFEYALPGAGEDRAEVDRVLSLIQRRTPGEPTRIQIDRGHGPGFRALALHPDNSNMVYSDDNGSLELTRKDGKKTLVAKNADGTEVFSGPVNTPEERKALPPDVRARLERLEGMHDMTFRTDGDFQGAEVRVFTPRGIAYPLPAPSIPPRHRPVFY